VDLGCGAGYGHAGAQNPLWIAGLDVAVNFAGPTKTMMAPACWMPLRIASLP